MILFYKLSGDCFMRNLIAVYENSVVVCKLTGSFIWISGKKPKSYVLLINMPVL
jgi:hypothetical protein